jgi:hypothetical protein
MDIVGDTGEGKIGVLTKDQAVAWLEAKDSRAYGVILRNKLKSCVENIMAAAAGGGGGNLRYTFEGAAVYHVSNGAAVAGGVTVFYVPRPGNIAKCIALGYHVGAQTYDLTWVHHDWKALRNVNRISLD